MAQGVRESLGPALRASRATLKGRKITIPYRRVAKLNKTICRRSVHFASAHFACLRHKLPENSVPRPANPPCRHPSCCEVQTVPFCALYIPKKCRHRLLFVQILLGAIVLSVATLQIDTSTHGRKSKTVRRYRIAELVY